MGGSVAPEAFAAWGWRIPFLMSMLLVGLGLYVQLKLEDTADFRALQAQQAEAQARAVKELAAEKAVSLDKARTILRAQKRSPIPAGADQASGSRSRWRPARSWRPTARST